MSTSLELGLLDRLVHEEQMMQDWLGIRHFISMQQSWQKNSIARGVALSVLTRGFERIWITAEEVRKIGTAIQTQHSPVTIG